MTILDKIVEAKKQDLIQIKKETPLEQLKQRVNQRRVQRGFKSHLMGDGVQLIGEIKKVSPVVGVLREAFDPADLALIYERGGASALSVLTDEKFFGGKLDYLPNLKGIVKLPLLRKDFIVDPYQLYESAAYESDAILLIASLLSQGALSEFLEITSHLGMEALVEVHTEDELAKALESGAEAIGINNRDLKTFKVDLATTERLIREIPKDKVVVSESGIQSRQDVERLAAIGVHAVLIGQAFMESPDIEGKIRTLMGR